MARAGLVERLEKAAKKYDRKARASLSHAYDAGAADLRELLTSAATHIRAIEKELVEEKGPWLQNKLESEIRIPPLR